DDARRKWQPSGERVGWLDGENLYLEPEGCFAVVQRLAWDQGDILALTSTTLHKRVADAGLLASTEKQRGKLTVRRQLEGQRRPVLHLHADALVGPERAQSAQSAQRDQNQRSSSASGFSRAPVLRADSSEATP